MARLILLLTFLSAWTSVAGIWDEAPLDYKIKRFHSGMFYSQVDHKTREFIVLLPEAYNSEEEVEVIYFLSGGNGNARGMAIQLQDEARRLEHSFFQQKLWVSLSMNNHAMWTNNTKEQSTDIFLEFVSYFESHVKTNSTRNLVGHSLGGSGAFHFAFEFPIYFHRFAAVSGPILLWNIFDITYEQIEEFVRNHAPQTEPRYFAGIIENMKKDFGTRQAYVDFDFYNRVLTKSLPDCFALMMGEKDQLGFAHMSREFIKFSSDREKKISYIEQTERDHGLSSALDDIAWTFQNCAQ